MRCCIVLYFHFIGTHHSWKVMFAGLITMSCPIQRGPSRHTSATTSVEIKTRKAVKGKQFGEDSLSV